MERCGRLTCRSWTISDLRSTQCQAVSGQLGLAAEVKAGVPLLAGRVDVTSELLKAVAHDGHAIVHAGVVERRRAAPAHAAIRTPRRVALPTYIAARINKALEYRQIARPRGMMQYGATDTALLWAALVAHPTIWAHHIRVGALPN